MLLQTVLLLSLLPLLLPGWSYYLDMISRNQSAASPAMAGAHAAIDVQQQQQLLEPELQEQVL